MDEDRKQWWYLRAADLLALGKSRVPLYVYNEETLNEIFFDLSATEVIAGLFYPFEANFHHELEAIQNACPKFSLYMEVPTHLFCYAGILLIKAIESGSAEGTPYVRVLLSAKDSLLDEIRGRPQQIFNLSKPDRSAVPLNKTARKYGDSVMLYPKEQIAADAGDILLITHMGAYSQPSEVQNTLRNGIREWYLNVRCFCPVALHKRGAK